MIYEVEISEQAEADLRGIFEYIAYTLLAPENAGGQLDRLETNILKLNQMLERFRLYEKEPWHSRGLRMLPVDNFVVLYISDQKRGIVTVIRVMYGGRDIEKELRDIPVFERRK